MLINFFLLVIFFSYSSSHASSHAIESDIGKHLYRALTRRGALHHFVQPNHQFLFSNGHWVKGLSYEPKSSLLYPNTEIEKFHQKLGAKLITLGNHLKGDTTIVARPENNRVGCLKRKDRAEPLSIRIAHYNKPDAAAQKNRLIFESHIKPNFVDGHCFTLSGEEERTNCHKVFACLYEEQEESEDSEDSGISFEDKDIKMINWLVPIEQTFLCKTLKDYKRKLALFNTWGAYSRFALIVIPENTPVCAHTGTVASQSLIENYKREEIIRQRGIHGYQTEITKRIGEYREYLEKLHPKLSEIEINEKLETFCEFCPGGATQLYIEYSKDYYLYDIDALYEDNDLFKRNFSTKKIMRKNPELRSTWVSPNDWTRSHFLHDSSTVEIRMHEGLERLFAKGGDGFSFTQEREDIDNILRHLRGQPQI